MLKCCRAFRLVFRTAIMIINASSVSNTIVPGTSTSIPVLVHLFSLSPARELTQVQAHLVCVRDNLGSCWKLCMIFLRLTNYVMLNDCSIRQICTLQHLLRTRDSRSYYSRSYYVQTKSMAEFGYFVTQAKHSVPPTSSARRRWEVRTCGLKISLSEASHLSRFEVSVLLLGYVL